MTLNSKRRVIEEQLGDSVVGAIDAFVFKDIEDEMAAVAVFDFIDDITIRKMLGKSLRGVRWQQKVGLVLARYVAHPAHAAQVRSQLIEYGAIAEMCLRQVVMQHQTSNPPGTFDKLITRATALGVLSQSGADAAHALRQARNCVHLHLGHRPPSAARDGRRGWKAFTTVINECRSSSGLTPWHPGRSPQAPVAPPAGTSLP